MKINKKIVAAAVVLALLAVWSIQQRSLTTPAATGAKTQADHIEVAETDVLTLAEQELLQGVSVSGTLRAVQSAWVKARVAGELQEFRVREGDSVKAGQVLGRIDPTEYERRYRQAQEQAQAAKSQVDIAQKQYDNCPRKTACAKVCLPKARSVSPKSKGWPCR